MLFCPVPTMAFIVVSFHCRTSLAKVGGARVRIHRLTTRLAAGTMLPMALRPCIMARSSFPVLEDADVERAYAP
jgi:hypothetical protein